MYRTLAVNAVRGNLQRVAPIAAAATRATPSTSVYKRNLVSTVLLSRDVYEKQNVPELKSELKQRGLSTSGKRKDLISRLLDNDSRNTKVFPSSEVGDQSQRRSASTKSTSSTKESDVKPEPSIGAVGGEGKATIPHPPDMEPGQVSSNIQDSHGDITQNKVLEAHPTAPGVPPEKTARVPIVFDVKIPYEEVVEDKGPEIPLMTGYFHPENPMFRGLYTADDGPLAHMPKVMTISGEETYHGGGPSHHGANFDDPDITRAGLFNSTTEVLPDGHTITSAIGSMFKTMREDLGIPVNPALEKKAKEATGSTMESTKTMLKDARDNLAARLGSSSSGPGSGSGSGTASYSTVSGSYSGGNTRPLNDDETRGLYVLAAIVVGGFLLGGVTKPTKRQVEKVKTTIAEKAQEAKKEVPVLSDAELKALVAKAEGALKGR